MCWVTITQDQSICEIFSTAVALSQLDKHMTEAMDMHATVEELLDAIYSVKSVQSLCNEDN
jgi:alkylhydroperoxidase/carboxymuconolactone decarboxylase family protein YurZ